MSWDSFAGSLRELRAEAGHASSRAFFNSAGGRTFFGCTYRQYLNVENAASAPGSQLVERIALALKLTLEPEKAQNYFRAYILCLVGREELYNLILKAIGRRAVHRGAPRTPLRKAMVRNFKARTVPLTNQQSETTVASGENYWTFAILANDAGHWSPAQLAQTTGFTAAAVNKSLRALMKVKLIQKDRKGRYLCPLAGKVLLHPRDHFFAPRLERLRRNWDQMAVKQGRTTLKQHLFTRASESELEEYYPHLVEAVHSADICTTDRKGSDTAFFLIETQVRKILPF